MEKKRENYCDDLEKFRELEMQLEEHKATLERKVSERQSEVKNIAQDLDQTKESIKRISAIVDSQEITVEDVKKMQSERAVLDENIEKLAAEKMIYSKQIWEIEMELSKRFEELSATVHIYNTNAKKLGLIPENAENAKGKRYSIKLMRELLFQEQKNFFADRSIEEILKDLSTVKNELSAEEKLSRDSLMEILDAEGASEDNLAQKNDEIKVSAY